MRDYRAIAERLIKNRRWYRVRAKVRHELESAYQDGLRDAATEVTANSSALSERILVLGKEGTRPPVLPNAGQWTAH
jgi:hypothetical protein